MKDQQSAICKMYDLDEMTETINRFRDLVRDMSQIGRICGEVINENDRAIGDIRHLCEFDYPKDAKKRTRVCRMLHDLGRERRDAKNIVMLLEPLSVLTTKYSGLVNDMCKVANEVGKTKKRIDNPTYEPRVLKELFVKEETEG